MTVEKKSDSRSWSWDQDKAFENAIATYPEDLEDCWEKIAHDVRGKTLEEDKDHYELLIEDIKQIESGRVPLPSYNSCSEGSSGLANEEGDGKNGEFVNADGESNYGSKASRSDQERRKGIAWTEDEHRLFLLGLEKYGKGDWRSISRNFVVTRTPTQVASHAQKYFIRLNSMNKDRRRTSIHDITSINSGDISTPQDPITGQTNTDSSGPSSAKTEKQPVQPPTGVGVYGAPIRQPVGGPAVGTPVNLPGPPHVAYGIRAPVGGSMVSGGPMVLAPMAYLMPHTSGHR